MQGELDMKLEQKERNGSQSLHGFGKERKKGEMAKINAPDTLFQKMINKVELAPRWHGMSKDGEKTKIDVLAGNWQTQVG